LVCTRNVPETAAFYRDVLGLPQQSADKYSVVFRTGGVDLRVSLVPDFVTNGHTVMGFRVSDIMAAVQALREKGI
jgi:catechol 2,3-dioxygenase-like lactoylglutathione lyase family enzyme